MDRYIILVGNKHSYPRARTAKTLEDAKRIQTAEGEYHATKLIDTNITITDDCGTPAYGTIDCQGNWIGWYNAAYVRSLIV